MRYWMFCLLLPWISLSAHSASLSCARVQRSAVALSEMTVTQMGTPVFRDLLRQMLATPGLENQPSLRREIQELEFEVSLYTREVSLLGNTQYTRVMPSVLENIESQVMASRQRFLSYLSAQGWLPHPDLKLEKIKKSLGRIKKSRAQMAEIVFQKRQFLMDLASDMPTTLHLFGPELLKVTTQLLMFKDELSLNPKALSDLQRMVKDFSLIKDFNESQRDLARILFQGGFIRTKQEALSNAEERMKEKFGNISIKKMAEDLRASFRAQDPLKDLLEN